MAPDLDLTTMQAVRMKGRCGPSDVAAATGSEEHQAKDKLDVLVERGLLVEKNERFRITRDGRAALAAALDEERSAIDLDALHSVYDDFIPVNADFKQMVTDWQQRDGQPNDHADADYDGEVLERLDGVDERLRPILEHASTLAPRLAAYGPRFERAMAKVREGDHAWFLRPMIDSYHTVWFELHEELIGLAGFTRAEEAAAGRAE